jgi:excisionase family DNA binding protein
MAMVDDSIPVFSLPLLVSALEAARVIGITEDQARRLLREGNFPLRVVKIGKLYKVRRAELNRYLRFLAGDDSAAG